MSKHQNQAKALIDAWEVISRFRWQFIVPAFLVMAGVLGASLMLPRKYKAEAIFERRTDMVMEEIALRGGSSQSYTDPQQALVYEVAGEPAIDELLRSIAEPLRDIAARRGRDIDVPTLRNELIGKVLVRQDIGTKALDRVRVSFTTADADVASLVVNTLVQNHIDRTRNEMDRRLRQSESFFKEEVARARTRIEDLENRKLNFQIAHAELLPDNPHNVQAALSEAQIQHQELCDRRDSLVLKIQALRRSLEETPETAPSYVTTRNPDLDRLERKLTELQSQMATYVNVYKMTTHHPDLVDLQRQIEQTQATLAVTPAEVVSEKRFTRNPKHAELELMLAQAGAEAEALTNQCMASTRKIADLNEAAVRLFPVRADYSKMEREVDQALRQLAFWEGNLNRVAMSLTAESGNRGVQLNFLKPAEVNRRPISPDLLHVLMAAVGLGMLSGAVSVLFAHRTNESFHSGEELSTSVGVPLIGCVSEIISHSQRRMKRLRRYVLAPLNLAAMTGVLVAMTALLYLNLKRPERYDKLMDRSIQLTQGHIVQNSHANAQ